MPRFYGQSMGTVIQKGMTLDDAMRIKNDSPCSEEANYGNEDITDEEIDSFLGINNNFSDKEQKEDKETLNVK
jgi:hypothetical protein